MRPVLFASLAVLLLALPSSAERPRDRVREELRVVTQDDVKSEISFGKDVAASILEKYPLYKNDKATRYLNLVGKALARFATRPELEFTFGILDSEMVNAMSAPGGYIFISRGAMEAMDDEAELAGVLSHEIIHTSQRHIVKELNIRGADNSVASGMSHLIGGATESVNVALEKAMGEAMSILFEKGYKKTDEMEADSLGTVLLSSAGYDTGALKRYFQKLKTVKGANTASIEKIHQPLDDRAVLINQVIEKNGLPEKGFKGKERFHENVQIGKK